MSATPGLSVPTRRALAFAADRRRDAADGHEAPGPRQICPCSVRYPLNLNHCPGCGLTSDLAVPMFEGMTLPVGS